MHTFKIFLILLIIYFFLKFNSNLVENFNNKNLRENESCGSNKCVDEKGLCKSAVSICRPDTPNGYCFGFYDRNGDIHKTCGKYVNRNSFNSLVEYINNCKNCSKACGLCINKKRNYLECLPKEKVNKKKCPDSDIPSIKSI